MTGVLQFLTMNGGGMLIAWVLKCLAILFPKTDIPKHFILAGTSAGALATGLFIKYRTAPKALEAFMEYYNPMFTKRNIFDYWRGWSKYTKKSEKILKKLFGDLRCCDIEERFYILALRTDKPGIKVFTNKDKCYFWEAMAASMAAPSFFTRVLIKLKNVKACFLDGGLIQNNPTLCAMMGERRRTGVSFDRMRVLNFRTGGLLAGQMIGDRILKVKILQLILELITEANVIITSFFCKQLLGLRYIEVIPAGVQGLPLDCKKEIKRLLAVGETTAFLNRNSEQIKKLIVPGDAE